MEWKNKVERLFKSKSKRAMTIVAFVLVLMMMLIPMAVLAQYGESWSGQGTDSLNCDLAGEGPRTEDGWIHWVYSTKGDSTDAELVVNGTTYSPSEPLDANVWHFYTEYFDLETLTATITLDGVEEGTAGGGLVISDYCPGTNGEVDLTGDTGSISIIKVVQGADEVDLETQPDIDFEVNVKSDDGEYDEDHDVNPSTGATVIENLPLGYYTITEVDSDGYENVSIVDSQFELTAGVVVEVVVTNIEMENGTGPIGNLRGSISITKVVQGADEVDLETQPDVDFEVNVKHVGGIYDEIHIVNPSTGATLIEDLPLGAYTITEVDSDGYENVSILPSQITLTANNMVAEVIVTNRMIEVGTGGDLTNSIKLNIEKVLLNPTGNPVPSDVVFTVILDGGSFDEEVITFSVNSPAEVVYADGLEFDTEYTITEVKHANYGFVSINPDGPFTLTEDDFEVTVVVTNRQLAAEGETVVVGEVETPEQVIVPQEPPQSEVETPEQVVVAQEQPQTTPDPDERETVIVGSEEPQTDPTQETETADSVTVDPDKPKTTPGTSGTVIPILSLGVLLLSSGGVLLRKYKDQ